MYILPSPMLLLVQPTSTSHWTTVVAYFAFPIPISASSAIQSPLYSQRDLWETQIWLCPPHFCLKQSCFYTVFRNKNKVLILACKVLQRQTTAHLSTHIGSHSCALFNSGFSSLNMPHDIWPWGVFHTHCYLCLDTFPSPLLNLSFFQNFLYSPL